MKTKVLPLPVATQMQLAHEVLSLSHEELLQFCRKHGYAFLVHADHYVALEDYTIYFDTCATLECSFYRRSDRVAYDTCQSASIELDNQTDATPYLTYCNRFEPSFCERRWMIPDTNIEIAYNVYHQGNQQFRFQVLEE
ncbi:MAG: hypothetical protein LIP08_13290 [Bacteroides sp.]|nr:hypothetical protein [Bacteroides sp.]